MSDSRVRFLEQTLTTLNFDESLRALDWMMEEMCAEKGFKRHSGAHYYYHLVDATQDLLNFNVRDQNIITACLLHDAVEDVDGITFKMIQDKFNSHVADYVSRVTKKPDLDYKNTGVMTVYMLDIGNTLGSALIKTADRKHNFSTLKDASPEKKLKQAIETENFFIPHFKEWRTKYPRHAGYFFSAKTAIEPHLWEIKEHHEHVAKLEAEIKRIQMWQ